MASILDTVLGIGPQRARRGPQAPGARQSTSRDSRGRSRLTEITDFGADPGSVRMLTYAPQTLKPGAALVVVLHGCTQTAEAYDAHSGWSTLADAFGFALLYPEQRRGNNPMNCFNWFQTADSARGLGEARSIREMIEFMVGRHGLDRGRVYVLGLSAGGAMTANMLAGYPETFAAGAVIAGLPCGAAASAAQAFEAMSRPAARSDAELGDAVRAGAPYGGPWPRVSVWHGLADQTVAPGNAEQLVRQWLDVHGAPVEPTSEERTGARHRRVWTVDGRAVVEATTIAGMGHGTPLGGEPGERAGPYMLDVGVSSTREIARFFGLSKADAAVVIDAAARPAKETKPEAAAPARAPASGGKATTPAASAPARAAERAPSADHDRRAGRSAAADPGADAPAMAPPASAASIRDVAPAGANREDRKVASRAVTTAKAPSGPAAERPPVRPRPAFTGDDRRGSGGRAGHDAQRADPDASQTPGRFDIRGTIEKALRTAGLMR